MIVKIALFELKKRLKMLSTWIYFSGLAIAAGLIVLGNAGAFSGISVGFGAEKVHANSPSILLGIVSVVTRIGMIITAGIFGQSLHEDVEHRMSALLFTTPLRKRDYLVGRFLGAFATTFIVFSGVGVGAFIAAHMPAPVTEPTAFGPENLAAYAWPYLIDVVPNVFICGGLFFAVSALSKKMMPVYMTAILLLVGFLAAGALISSLDNKTLAALVDPFGDRAASVATQYWTVVDQNTRLVPLTGVMLANRALWMGAAAVLLAFMGVRFRPEGEAGRERARDTAPAPAPTTTTTTTTATGAPTPERGLLRLLLGLTRRGVVDTVFNTYFIGIVFAGFLITAVIVWQTGKAFETPTWPVTYLMAGASAASFALFVIVVIIFTGGEIVWRERDARMDQILDAMPVPTWVTAIAKVLVLFVVQLLLALPVVVVGVAVQTIRGYHNYEIPLYGEIMALHVLDYLPMCMLAFFLHVVINNKYVAHFAMIGVFVAMIFISNFGVLPNVLLWGSEPDATYSDMNGFGHFLPGALWFRAYWIAFSLVLVVVGVAFFVRGSDAERRLRTAEARRRLKRGLVPAAALSLLAFVGIGAFLSVQTLVVNTWHTNRHQERERAEYERQYKKTQGTPQPRVTGVVVAFDIDPSVQSLRAHGTYTLTNKTDAAVASVTVTMGKDDNRAIDKLTVAGAAASTVDERFGLYTFPVTLAPGASLPLEFDLRFSHHGISNDMADTAVVDNGTFFNSGSLPHLGYQEDGELTQDNDRKKYDLAPKERLPPPTAPHARDDNYISSDADWVTFDATVSTSPDQIAIAPGYLEREWQEGGRRYFHYTMDVPILHFFSVLSARYAVKKDRWNDVALEVYYDPKHPYNVDRMIEGMKDALAYCTKNYGPYQHRQLRILEFPRYQTFAQSFPNTIPYSESIGFIAHYDVDDESAVDYPYYVTAHETAHQWWAHQVIGARAQGETMMSETLAEYTALMVMQQKYGAAHMRRFLKQEADGYLRGRAFESKREVPLVQVENQPYLHYNKGGQVMYELADAIGEDAVDRGLSSFLDKNRNKGPPYPVATELVDELKAQAKPEDQSLFTDLFETITLFDSHTSAVECVKAGDKYELTMHLSVKKVRASELGEEKEVPVDRPMEIGALDDKDIPLALEKRTIASGDSVVKLTVDKAPAKAGIDPLVKLLDRRPDDNVVAVSCPK